MVVHAKITALRQERQHLTHKAGEAEYLALFRDCQPGQNVYWNGFGDPPSLTCRADFDDIEYNRQRQAERRLVKGRFVGGNLGWIIPEDLELFAAAFVKPLVKPQPRQQKLLELIRNQGPLTIQQMKQITGLLVKEITPALHRLQEAFLIYEDQHDGEWDRGWLAFDVMFPQADIAKYTRPEALALLLQRFAYRCVSFDVGMAKAFYKLPEKEIKTAVAALVDSGVLVEDDGNYLLREDAALLESYSGTPKKSVFAMHRNDFLVKSNEHWLKEKYPHPYPDTLYYLLVDGEFGGAVAGKFRYTPEVEDIFLDLPPQEAACRKDEVLAAVRRLCSDKATVKRYEGAEL